MTPFLAAFDLPRARARAPLVPDLDGSSVRPACSVSGVSGAWQAQPGTKRVHNKTPTSVTVHEAKLKKRGAGYSPQDCMRSETVNYGASIRFIRQPSAIKCGENDAMIPAWQASIVTRWVEAPGEPCTWFLGKASPRIYPTPEQSKTFRGQRDKKVP